MPDPPRRHITRYVQHLLISAGVLIAALYALGVELPPAVQSVAANRAPIPSPTPAALLPIGDTAAMVRARGSLSTRTQAPPATPLPTPVPPKSVNDDLPLAFPVPGGSISQSFRPGHEGIDIAGGLGASVIAAADGRVLSAGWRNNGGGLVVEILHSDGLKSAYNHLGSISVVAGQELASGTVIGTVGCTGVCYGPHVQFDVRIDGRLIDPTSPYDGVSWQ